MDFGAFEGKTAQELSGTPAYREFLKGGLDNPPPGGESARSAVTRSFRALSGMISDMMENGYTECAAITHGGVIMNMLAGFGLPKRRPLDYPCDFGCGYEILITAAMWQRSGAFEILGAFPEEPEK